MPLLRDLSFSKAHPSTTYGHLYGECNKKIVYIYSCRERERELTWVLYTDRGFVVYAKRYVDKVN